jgi:tetratricopeptide (TPR) repeat protein
MLAPQLATASITDRIQALSRQESILPFDVKSIQRDIERLKTASAKEAYMLFGMLHAALGEYESSKEMHLKCLRLSMDVVGLVNYGISMRKLGRASEARDIFQKAFELSPADPMLFEKLMHMSTMLCDYSNVENLILQFEKSNPSYDIEGMKCMETFRSIESHLDLLKIPLHEYKMVGAFIEQTMLEFGVVNESMHERLGNFDGVQHLYLEVPVPVKSVQQLVAINDRIADLVLSCDDIVSWDRLVVNFVGSKKSASVSVVA